MRTQSTHRQAVRAPAAAAAAAATDATDSKEGKMSAQGRSLAGWLRLKTVQSILVCLFYASSSITLSVVNKAVLSSYDFQCYFLLLAIQLVVGIVFCAASRRLGNPFSVPSIRDPGRLLAAAPMATFFVINVSVGCVARACERAPLSVACAVRVVGAAVRGPPPPGAACTLPVVGTAGPPLRRAPVVGTAGPPLQLIDPPPAPSSRTRCPPAASSPCGWSTCPCSFVSGG